MDVTKNLWLIATISIFCFGCENNDRPAGNTTLTKPAPSSDCDSQRISGEYLVRWKSGKHSVVPGNNDDDFENGFLQNHNDEIVSAEPHYAIQISPRASLQTQGWGGDLNWGSRGISAPEVWAKGITGKNIVVAVIDSGVQLDHPELENSFAVNAAEEINGVDDDENGFIDDRIGYDFAGNSGLVVDRTGHGTHVSGIIGADHGTGAVNGVAPDAKILPLSFISEGGLGSTYNAIRAVKYAAAMGAKVINASWGGSGCSKELQEEIENIQQDNILFVSAAGNRGQNLSRSPEYPAVFPLDNLLTVGASTFDQFTAGFSNWGDLVDVVAPGAFILSTYPQAFEAPDADGLKDGVQELDGTSMSTPFVAGAAALLWSAHPEATYLEIIAALTQTVDVGFYPVASRGQINVNKALDYLEDR